MCHPQPLRSLTPNDLFARFLCLSLDGPWCPGLPLAPLGPLCLLWAHRGGRGGHGTTSGVYGEEVIALFTAPHRVPQLCPQAPQ